MLQCQQKVNKSLNIHLNRDMPSQILRDAMAYACIGNGKRIRPALVYGSTLAVGGELDLADNAACAVELIHSYSLVHDDLPVMDDDDLRRGKPSLHKAFDEATAILVGDALQSQSFQLLAEPLAALNEGIQLRMIQILAEAAGANGMVGGQALDFQVTGQTLDLAKLETMHKSKTGAIIRACVKLGALCKSSVSAEQLSALDKYGECIGLAFQVQDDILDVTAKTKTLGKPQGSDEQLKKPTYVSLLGLNGAHIRANDLKDQALESLTKFPENANLLRKLATYIVDREH
ncbi:MAG: polyprenyl synthetase family protein [Gammaproteobacteria bacterium]|jgi:geranylgeranyl pyrophosphate synthase|nr:geranyl transferase [Gammaproteobacteria bacterium]MCH2343647.1 polyprenyl synthetase family protein [Pseudomonadales bacterium]MCS5580615.1 polyprenyl synthetase family protein [Gammaproteobacteria bacterium]MEE3171627.1 farnesyl diphosphate synthase [Pseudomonadota bacterium]|tara:strand:+ start:8296 stop:9162 length:867 start_codon:yes stop_codon:yes gene_type:complete